MKSTITAAALATLAFATPALAQATDNTGFYGAVHVGLNIPNKQPFTLPDVEIDLDEGEGVDLDTIDIGFEIDSKNAIEFGGTLGYDFGLIRADVDVSYSRAKVRNLTLTSIDGTPAPADTLEDGIGVDLFEIEDAEVVGNTIFFEGGKLRRLSAMANLWIDIPVGSGFAPYVGGGAGIQGLEFEGDDKSSFAWQLGAGASVALNDRIAISADYRYRQQKGFTLDTDEFGELRFGKVKSSSIFLSLRFNFGGASSGSTRSGSTQTGSARPGDCSGPC